MMRRLSLCLGATVLFASFVAPPQASAQQAISVYLGGFVPKGMDSRGGDDVIFRNGDFLSNRDGRPLNPRDLSGVTVGAEYLVGLGDFLDAGLGIGFYQGSTPAVYTDLMNANGTDIEQDLKLRIVPVTATIRFLPLGHHDAITPYFGAGVGIYNWRYTETGQFVDGSGNIFRDTFEGKDTTVGPVILGGVRVPIGNGGIGGEIRYQGGSGNLPASESFAGSKINLGGFNYLVTFTVGF